VTKMLSMYNTSTIKESRRLYPSFTSYRIHKGIGRHKEEIIWTNI